MATNQTSLKAEIPIALRGYLAKAQPPIEALAKAQPPIEALAKAQPSIEALAKARESTRIRQGGGGGGGLASSAQHQQEDGPASSLGRVSMGTE